MFPYFVPISLLVLAGFTLGLLVGWLVWGSSKSAANREPEKPEEGQEREEPEEPEGTEQPQERNEPEEPYETPEAASTGLRPAPPESTPDPPIWQVREVPAFGEPVAGVYPNGRLPQKSTRSIG